MTAVHPNHKNNEDPRGPRGRFISFWLLHLPEGSLPLMGSSLIRGLSMVDERPSPNITCRCQFNQSSVNYVPHNPRNFWPEKLLEITPPAVFSTNSYMAMSPNQQPKIGSSEPISENNTLL